MGVSPQQQKDILELHQQDRPYRAISDAVGVPLVTVRKVIHEAGVQTNPTQTHKATEERLRRLTQQRLDLAEHLMQDANMMRERAWDQYKVVVNGAEAAEIITLDEPPLREQKDAFSALSDCVRTIDTLLEGMGGNGIAQAESVLDQLLDGLKQLDTTKVVLYDGDYDPISEAENNHGGD